MTDKAAREAALEKAERNYDYSENETAGYVWRSGFRDGWEARGSQPCPFELENIEVKNENDRLLATVAQRDAALARVREQNKQMRATLIAIEPRCEYVGCEEPGPHVCHSETGVAQALEGE